jgi:type IV pilus assembly protein PilW
MAECRKTTQRRQRQRGLSIIELMVGVAIGMFIIGGAIKLFVDMFGNNRRLLVEARVNQDLRAAADIIARDIRRAGYWSGAVAAINPAPGSAPAANPFANATITANSIDYTYDRGASAASAAGFSLSNNTIYMTVGAASQPLTDPTAVRVTRFDIVNSASAAQTSELYTSCPCYAVASGAAGACPNIATSASRPQAVVRWVDIVIEGEAPTASAVRRQVIESVRVRNDLVSGSCP